MANKSTVYTENKYNENDELISKRWITRECKDIPQFVKMYLEDLKLLKKLTHAEFRILHSMCVYLEYDTNEFFLNKSRREELADISGVTYNTINQAISNLTKKNMLIKIASGLYRMNPTLFFRGPELARDKVFQLCISYTIKEQVSIDNSIKNKLLTEFEEIDFS